MSADGSAGALGDIAGMPHVVLDDDELDVLELALEGSSGPPSSSMPHAGDNVLTDRENTPLATVSVSAGASPSLRPLRPMARGAGPHWDPAVRRRSAEVRALLEGREPVLGIVVDDVPTRADVERLHAVIANARPGAVVLAVPVARRPPRVGEVGPAGRTRAALALGRDLEAHDGRFVLTVAVPWPARGQLAPTPLPAVLAAYGVPAARTVSAGRSAEERERIVDVGNALEREVRALYPPASADEVLATLRRPTRRGAVVLFTGLPGSGKSTVARALVDDLRDTGSTVTLLDGDEVRQRLSSELGFDPASRERNLDRIGFVAGLIADHGGIAVAAPIAPTASGRASVRGDVRAPAVFLLVWISTPLEVCEARDRKGHYARARRGEIADFTGISAPYEPPDDADVVIDTSRVEVEEAVRLVREALEARLTADGAA